MFTRNEAILGRSLKVVPSSKALQGWSKYTGLQARPRCTCPGLQFRVTLGVDRPNRVSEAGKIRHLAHPLNGRVTLAFAAWKPKVNVDMLTRWLRCIFATCA